MAAPCFIAWSGVTSALTAPLSGITITTSTKTLLQVEAGSTGGGKIRIIGWGYKLIGTPSAPVLFELVETGLVGGTSGSTATISPWNDIGAASNESASFSPSAEGTITASRLLGMNPDTGSFFERLDPLGREAEIANDHFVRIRATATSGTAAGLGFIIWEA